MEKIRALSMYVCVCVNRVEIEGKSHKNSCRIIVIIKNIHSYGEVVFRILIFFSSEFSMNMGMNQYI